LSNELAELSTTEDAVDAEVEAIADSADRSVQRAFALT
jgi:hypothetical protein